MTKQAQNCPICHSKSWSTDQLAGKILGLPAERNVLHCTACGQMALYPQLTNAELKSLYSDAYFNSGLAAHSQGQNLKVAASDYISTTAPSRHAQFARTIKILRKLHPHAITFLDVGAATGDMVKIAIDHGFAAEGIEFSDYAVNKAFELYAIRLQQTSLSDLNRSNFYDLIHLNHVFEHFNEPQTELVNLHRLLKQNGGLFIEVPYQFNWIERLIFRMRNRRVELSVESLHHPYFYTPNTIRKLLEDHNFEIRKITVFDPNRYPADTLLKHIKKAIWWSFSLVSIGNYIQVFAIRK